MPRNLLLTYASDTRFIIEIGPAGAVKRGEIVYSANGGQFVDSVVVGNGPEFGVDFGTLGTAQQRAAFIAILQAAVAAGRIKIGDV